MRYVIVRSFPDGGLNRQPGDIVDAAELPNAPWLVPQFVRPLKEGEVPVTPTKPDPAPPAEAAADEVVPEDGDDSPADEEATEEPEADVRSSEGRRRRGRRNR